MAHQVSRLVAASAAHDRFLVVCGVGHSGYSFGVPERIFAAHPELRAESYGVYAYKADESALREEERTARTERGAQRRRRLREIFGSREREVADVAFVYDE